MSKILFGPVSSRRLGRSLGVSLIPAKTCSFDCLYCYERKELDLTVERRTFFPTSQVMDEIKDFISDPDRVRDLDVITIAGHGEPSLALNMGEVIRRIKSLTPIPVAVITNSSLMKDEAVREELMTADMVFPSIDAVTDEVFQKIDRPRKEVSLPSILKGIEAFSRVYTGRLYPEILVLEGYNDSDEVVQKIIDFLKRIKPDCVHLNVTEERRGRGGVTVASPSSERMHEIKSLFPSSIPVEIVGEGPSVFDMERDDVDDVEEKILAFLQRRPGVPGDISAGTGAGLDKIYDALDRLTEEGKILEIPDRTDIYYYINSIE